MYAEERGEAREVESPERELEKIQEYDERSRSESQSSHTPPSGQLELTPHYDREGIQEARSGRRMCTM